MIYCSWLYWLIISENLGLECNSARKSIISCFFDISKPSGISFFKVSIIVFCGLYDSSKINDNLGFDFKSLTSWIFFSVKLSDEQISFKMYGSMFSNIFESKSFVKVFLSTLELFKKSKAK